MHTENASAWKGARKFSRQLLKTVKWTIQCKHADPTYGSLWPEDAASVKGPYYDPRPMTCDSYPRTNVTMFSRGKDEGYIIYMFTKLLQAINKDVKL